MRAAQATLLARTDSLTDAEARAASRLPGWSVGHVLAHIARNADSVARRLEASARGEVVDQYPGGAEERESQIEAGAGRSAAELRADLAATHERIDAAVAAMDDAAWNARTRDFGGGLRPTHELPARRWREVELHLVDLGLGYEPEDWTDDFVTRILPIALADVGRRLPGLDGIDQRTVLAWSYGRADPPAGLPKLLPF